MCSKKTILTTIRNIVKLTFLCLQPSSTAYKLCNKFRKIYCRVNEKFRRSAVQIFCAFSPFSA